jgi:hypothetical protein
MLLYPAVDDAFAFHYRLNGRRVAIRSVNFDQAWAQIHKDLLAITIYNLGCVMSVAEAYNTSRNGTAAPSGRAHIAVS